MTVCVAYHPPSPPIAPFDAQTALIMNLFDPPDTSNGYISRQGVREDHSDPTRTINLAKWVVTAPYTDENEEISPPNKKIRTLTVNYERNFRTTTSILRQTLLRHVKIIFPKYFCLNYPREKAIFQTGSLMPLAKCEVRSGARALQTAGERWRHQRHKSAAKLSHFVALNLPGG